MVRIRKRSAAASGSFALTGGGGITVSGTGGHRKNFGNLSTGNSAATAFAGTKAIPVSGGMPVGIEVAALLLKQGDDGTTGATITDNWNKQNDFAAHITHFGGNPKVMWGCKLFVNGAIGTGETSWTVTTQIPFYVSQQHDNLIAAGQPTQAARWNFPLTHCFKSYTTSAFNAWMTAIPSWITEVRVCYQQEADRSSSTPVKGSPWPVLDYLNVYAQMEAARRIHANGAKVRLLKCLTSFKQIEEYHAGFTANDYYGIGQTWNLGTGATSTPSPTGQNWPSIIVGLDFYAPVDLLNQHGYYVDPVAFFSTNWGGQSGNKAWVQRMADISAAAGFDVDWNVPEWGAILPEVPPTGPYYLDTQNVGGPYLGVQHKGDYPNGLVRTAWLSACKNYLEGAGCLDMTYWCANGTPGTPTKFYHLDQGHNTAAPQYINHSFPESMALISSWAPS